MLSPEKIKEYEKKLEDARKELVEGVEEENKPAEFGNDVDSFDEEADEAEELGNHLSVAAAFKERINEIDAALNKIKKSEFGVCENCHGEIGETILDIVPESKLCENCKKEK